MADRNASPERPLPSDLIDHVATENPATGATIEIAASRKRGVTPARQVPGR